MTENHYEKYRPLIWRADLKNKSACVISKLCTNIFQCKLKVQQSAIGSTSTYEIPRAATIPADNNSHKVSIGIINLSPDFEYETVPKKNAHAYIKAKVVNKSEYALLAGPANVFFDNNFVAKVTLTYKS